MLDEEQQGNDNEQNANGNRRAERPVKGCAKEALYDVGDHRAGRGADKQRRQKIAERKNESESCPGEQAGNRKRKDDAQKCLSRSGGKVMRGFDQRARYVLEGRVDGQKNERRVDVRQHENDGERAIEKERDGLVCEMQVLQKAIEDAFAAKNGFPRVTPYQIAHPKGNDDKLVEQFFARARMKREVVGQRVTKQQGTQRHRGGDTHGAQEDFGVDGLGKESGVILQVPLMDHNSVVDSPEAVRKHQRVGKQEE